MRKYNFKTIEKYWQEYWDKNKTFKTEQEISKIFEMNLKDINSNTVVFSCGSGVTACVLALAYSLINDKYLPRIYDGSWAEYGKI